MKEICIDTGVFGIYFSKNRNVEVKELFDNIQNNKFKAFVVKPVLTEVYFHICRVQGISEANVQLVSLMHNYALNCVDLDEALILNAGKLKCQHQSALSMIDCMSIALCLRENMEFHTTEKMVKKIPHNTLERLRIMKYNWS
jgi:predicted nucleic acid-binding protein